MSMGLTLRNVHPQKSTLGIWKRSGALWLFAGVLTIGALLRFYQIGVESYWIDEMYTVVEGQQSAGQILSSGRLDQPPAYYLPFRTWVQMFGISEVSTRSFSALMGLVSVVLIYWLGKELFSVQAGLLSAFLMSISEFQIMYSQQARYYTFFELTTILSFVFMILALRSQKRFHFGLYIVSSALMIYSHAFGVFILAAQNLYVLLQLKKLRQVISAWLICQILVLVAVIPYFYPLFRGAGVIDEALSNTAPAPPPSLWQPFNSAYRFLMPLRFEQSWMSVLVNYLAAALFLGVGMAVYVLVQGPRNWLAAAQEWREALKKRSEQGGEILLVGSWLVVPLLLPFLLSWLVVPIFNHRYNIGAAPALYLLVALLLLKLHKIVPVILSLSTLLILIATGLRYYYVTDINQQWREAIQYVAENSARSETVVFPPYPDIDLKLKMMDWYAKDELHGCGLDMQHPEYEIWNHLQQCSSGQERFWVVYFTDEPMSRTVQPFFLNSSQTNVRLLEERQFVELTVYLFEWAQ